MNIDFSNFYDLVNPAFWDFLDNKSRVRISYGGAGSSKSYTAFQDAIYKLVAEPGHNFLICRKVGNSNRISTFPLIQQIISDLGLWSVIKMNKSDMSFTCKNGNMMICKGLDDIEKVKSITFPKGVLTDIIVEEASEITQKDFDQLMTRLRGYIKQPKNESYKIVFQITLLLNPINRQHWIKKQFFDLRSYQKDIIDETGKIKKKGISVYTLHTTYKDNKFIDDDYKDVLEGYAEIDFEFYRVYCLGEWGNFGNIIFSNWTNLPCPYKEEEFDSIYIGQDYGFEHPNVIVKIGFKDGNMYTYDELCCEHKTNIEFIGLNGEFDIFHKHETARGDSASPDKIKEWQQQGYHVIGAVKGPGSVARGIDFIKSQKWFIDGDRCPRTLQEAEVYHYKLDKNGQVNKNEDPVEIFDDAIKAHMYALEPLSKVKGKPGIISGTLSDQKKTLLELKKEQRKKKREVLKVQYRRRREAMKKNNET